MGNLFDSYVAGLFDGEGCISSTSQYVTGKYEIYPRVSIQITITNQHLGVLQNVLDEYGGQISFKDKNPNKCYVWRLIGKKPMRAFLESIQPYSIIKKEQIDLALQFIETLREENLGCRGLNYATHELRLFIHNKLKSAKKIVPIDGDINEQIPELAGKSLWDNPQPSLYEEGSETIMGTSQEDDGIVRTAQQCAEVSRDD